MSWKPSEESFRKGEVSCVEAKDQVLAIEVQQCNTLQLLPLQLFENKTKRAVVLWKATSAKNYRFKEKT